MSILATTALEDLRLARRPAADGFVETTGERIALFGAERGPLELWMWPLKVASQLSLSLQGAEEVGITSVEVTPGAVSFRLEGDSVRAIVEACACREAPAVVLRARLESGENARLVLCFRCDFRPMWPAGLGGQLSGLDDKSGAFFLAEELGRFAFLFGGPDVRVDAGTADHALPAGPVTLSVELSAGRVAPLVLAGETVDPVGLDESQLRGGGQAATGVARARAALAAARATFAAVLEEHEAERARVQHHWKRFREGTARLESPEPALDASLAWSLVALERAWVQVDGLGRGIVAGIGPSGHGERPGYAWFFDGDAMCAARAFSLTGAFSSARDVLRFAASHQRQDGKLMHELTLSAGLCDWLDDYPYAYYKALNTPDFVACLAQHVACTGDLSLARELWPHAERALAWCARNLDAEGRLSNESSGLGAVEAGPLSEAIAADAFLHGTYVEALRGASYLARALGQDSSALEREGVRAERSFETFWCESEQHYGFAHLLDGTLSSDLSVYVARALAAGAGADDRAVATALALNGPTSCADWGARMFATDSSVYDPASYNTGAVFPYLTNFLTLAQFRRGSGIAARQLLDSQAQLLHFGGLGLVEEHLEGAHARIPARGVAHQVFSSAALVESIVAGLFGIEADATRDTLLLGPALPTSWPRVKLHALRIGDRRLDVDLEQTDEALTLRCQGEPSLPGVSFAPLLPPLSEVDGPAHTTPAGDVRVDAVEMRGGIAVVRRTSGPCLHLPGTLPARGTPSSSPRLVGQRVENGTVVWRIAGPGGTSVRVPFTSGRPCRVEGAAVRGDGLELAFPAGAEGAWTRVELRAVPR